MGKKKKEPKSHGQTLGAAYRAAATGVILAAPAIDLAKQGVRDPNAYINHYRENAGPFATGLAIHTLDQYAGQRVFQHNSALGRGSLTAWLPEAYAMYSGYINRRGSGWGTGSFTNVKTGYGPVGVRLPGVWNPTTTYFALKYGGGLARKASNMSIFRPLMNPVKKGLGSAGAMF